MSRQHRKPKYEGDIRVVELAAYTAPKIIEDPRKDFVMYGEDNNYCTSRTHTSRDIKS
jgi:hypothetical protein